MEDREVRRDRKRYSKIQKEERSKEKHCFHLKHAENKDKRAANQEKSKKE